MEIDQLETTVNAIKDLMQSFSTRKVSFEVARILLVNQLHITMSEAKDRLEMYEAISKITLER